MNEVRKFRGISAIACVYTEHRVFWNPCSIKRDHSWKPIDCTRTALCRRAGRTSSEIRVSSRLNRNPLAMRHTGKPRIKSKEAGSILFARYSSQLVLPFITRWKVLIHSRAWEAHSNPLCRIPLKCTVKTSRSQQIVETRKRAHNGMASSRERVIFTAKYPCTWAFGKV